jgi:hypothetical protein
MPRVQLARLASVGLSIAGAVLYIAGVVSWPVGAAMVFPLVIASIPHRDGGIWGPSDDAFL